MSPSQYNGLDRVHIILPRDASPPYHPVTWLQSYILRGSLQHSCHLPRQVTHAPRKTKLLPCTSPVHSVMVVMSSQWGQETFYRTLKGTAYGRPNAIPAVTVCT